MKRRIAMIGAAIVLVAAGAVAWARIVPSAAREIPTTQVQRGHVQVVVHAIGDLRASRTFQVFVPPAGGALTVVQLATAGSALRAGDIIVEFDPSEQEFALEQARYDLQLADQEIAKAQAEAAVQAAEDEVALLRARFEVRRAELDAAANDLVGTVTAQQNTLLLEEARARLAQLEQEVRSHRESSVASTAMIRERRNKAQVAVNVAQRNIDNLQVRAPFDGFVTLRQNMMAYGGIVFSGSVMPEYRVGDTVSAGQLIADLIDASRVEIAAKLPEQDRANVAKGQPVTISVDALPDATLQGSVRTISGVASRQMFEGGTRRFDIAFDVTGHNARIRPGVSAALAIQGPSFDDALHVPRGAIFDVGGKTAVYARTPNGFESREVKVKAYTDTVAVIEGLDVATEVALVNPNLSSGGSDKRPAAPVTPRTAG